MTPIPHGLTDSAPHKYKSGALVTQRYILKLTDATYKYNVDDDKRDGSDEDDGLLLLIRQSGIGLPLGFHHDPSFLRRLCSPAPQPETSQVGPSLSLSGSAAGFGRKYNKPFRVTLPHNKHLGVGELLKRTSTQILQTIQNLSTDE